MNSTLKIVLWVVVIAVIVWGLYAWLGGTEVTSIEETTSAVTESVSDVAPAPAPEVVPAPAPAPEATQ